MKPTLCNRRERTELQVIRLNSNDKFQVFCCCSHSVVIAPLTSVCVLSFQQPVQVNAAEELESEPLKTVMNGQLPL